MDDPIEWSSAEILWEPNQGGYQLRIKHWADQRALALRHDQLLRAIRDSMPGRSRVTEEVIPMVLAATTTEIGEIIIGTDSMITLSEARELRDRMGRALYGSRQESQQAFAQDEADAAPVLALLKEPPE